MGKSCLGLDIGSNQVKVVELVKHRRHSRINAWAKFAPPQINPGSQMLTDPEALGAALRKTLDWYGIRTRRVVLGLNSPQISIKQITLPRMTPKELEQAIQLDIGDILKLPANGDTQSVYHSYEVLNQGEELDVLVVGCTRAFLDPYIAMIKAADLEPVVIDVAAFNLPRILYNGSNSRICYVDLGYSQTVIYVELRGAYSVYRVLPIGGQLLDEAIAAAHDVDTAEAQRMKHTSSLEEMLSSGSGSKHLLRSTLQQYVGGLLQTLDYLRSKMRASQINQVLDEIVLCGGIAHVKGFEDLFEQELGINVSIMNPFERYEVTAMSGIPEDHGAYANAVCLAARGLIE